MRKEKLQQIKQKQRLIRNYYEQVYGNKMDNLEEMDKFLERYNFQRLNQKETENINRLITVMKFKLKIFPQKHD